MYNLCLFGKTCFLLFTLHQGIRSGYGACFIQCSLNDKFHHASFFIDFFHSECICITYKEELELC